MTANTVIAPVLDLSGRQLKAGDWVVQSFNLGRCAAIKYSYVVGIGKNGALRLIGFERQEEGDWNSVLRVRENIRISWGRCGPYSVQFPERSVIVRGEDLPADLLKMIEDKYNGDPTYQPVDSV